MHRREPFSELLKLFSALSMDGLPMVGPTISRSTADVSDSSWKKRQGRSIGVRSNEKSPGQVRQKFHKSIQRQRKKQHFAGSVKQRKKLNNHKNGFRCGKPPTSQNHETSESASERWKFKKQGINCRLTWRQLSLQESRIGNVPRTSSTTWKCEPKPTSSEGDRWDRDEPSEEEVVRDAFRKKPKDRNPSSQPTSSHHNIRAYKCPFSELERHRNVKASHKYSDETYSSVLTHANDVKQPKIVLTDCLKSLEVNMKTPATASSDFILPMTKRSTSECDEFRTEDSGGGQKSAGPKALFNVPTWRQLTKQHAASINTVNQLVDCESRELGQTKSGQAGKKHNYRSVPIHGGKRKIKESQGHMIFTRVPTWRQLTKQMNDFSKYQNELKDNVGSCRTSSETKFTECEKFILKKRRWQLAQPQADSRLKFNQPSKKHRGIGSRVNSSELYCESQTSDMMIPLTELSTILPSVHSNSEEKSLERYHKHKRTASNDIISANQEKLPKAKSIISLTTKNLQLPTIKILLPHDKSSVRYKETSVSHKYSREITATTQKSLSSTKDSTVSIENTKEASTNLPNHPEPSTSKRNSTSYEQKMTTAQHKIPTCGGGQMAKPESKPSGSSYPVHMGMPDFQKEKPHYECTMCDYRGSHLGMIWNHILDHKMQDNGVKPHACDECDYRAKSETLLKSHKITHAGEKPYACDLCDRRCRSNTHLRIHKILHHNEKPFECRECDFKCADERLFQAHLRNHT